MDRMECKEMVEWGKIQVSKWPKVDFDPVLQSKFHACLHRWWSFIHSFIFRQCERLDFVPPLSLSLSQPLSSSVSVSASTNDDHRTGCVVSPSIMAWIPASTSASASVCLTYAWTDWLTDWLTSGIVSISAVRVCFVVTHLWLGSIAKDMPVLGLSNFKHDYYG